MIGNFIQSCDMVMVTIGYGYKHSNFKILIVNLKIFNTLVKKKEKIVLK